ncbi:hypothetical protein UFOVP1254_50 [uncultured Caudovirales phage]|uniref:Uncharacterized protein n=1 Tax=uncultured Caudovirales phage TaxID=2100421 RepID=A0A6J5RKZ0_9CAUD|nr:hypothetical protein UFOVP1254_50 [uncultured Caudovirales phage]
MPINDISPELRKQVLLCRVRKAHQLALRAADDLGKELVELIHCTPTGDNRNVLCDVNIHLGELQAKLKEFQVP